MSERAISGWTVKVSGSRVVERARIVRALVAIHQEQPGSIKGIVHGGQERIDPILQTMQKDGGKLRGKLTDVATLAVSTYIFDRINEKLSERLRRKGVSTTRYSYGSGLLEVGPESPSPAEPGYIGKVEKVRSHYLERDATNGNIPVIAPLGTRYDGRIFVIRGAAAASTIASELNSNLIIVTKSPGLLDKNGKIIDELSFAHYRELVASGIMDKDMQAQLDEGFKFKESRDTKREVLICRAKDLQKAIKGGRGTRLTLQ